MLIFYIVAVDPDNFPDNSIREAANHCRNPSNSAGGPWCYTNDPDIRWEYCNIPMCGRNL